MADSVPDEKLIIETPEQIPLEFPLAGIGSRFLSLAYDTLIQLLAAIVVGIIGAAILSGTVGRLPTTGIWVAAVLTLSLFVLQFGYFSIFEAIWKGQTPGKRHERLRVIKDSGQPISTYDAVARNFLRIVDGLPGFYAVGILSALLSSKHKRLGDYVAGTVVAHEKPLESLGQISLTYGEGVISGYEVAKLSPEEFHLMEAYLLRRSQLSADVRARLTRQILERIAAKLEISADDQQHSERLLENLVNEYRNRVRFR